MEFAAVLVSGTLLFTLLLEKIGKSSFRLLASPQSSQEKFHHPAGTVQGCSSIWGYKFYSINSIIVVVFIILLIFTALVTVALTYFQLAAEDHQWWWRSFPCGGSTGLNVFGYCIHYYYALTNMSGLLQTSFFFGYTACISCSIFLMLGTVDYLASLLFVHHIYGSIKFD
uniref:Transmembrane 9 superfamily member n=1 Tax=Quercus lobata TaxID=97700 RepID=A0A7N2L8E5_QUELO